MTEENIKRTYVVPLRRGFFNTPRYKRSNKAITVLKNFLVKHMKSNDIKLGKHLNEFLWKNGIKNPPAKVKVDVTKDKEGVVRAELSGKEYIDFKMQEKVDKNQSFKEKLKNKVTDTKGTTKTKDKETETKPKTETKKTTAKKVETKKDEVKSTTKAETKKPSATKKVEAEKPATVAEKPVETKPVEEKKAEVKTETSKPKSTENVESKAVKEDKKEE